ncbi:DEAD/DEAH box helicase [Tateyamaria sp. ANG-S1]|uniref:DEAD/DEAH box helicase n=1 Tax=Tateyamaria sp. ANG-S1 TaxID=1577905 RepID=UPI00057C55DC|nr:DEAD/DEAH box helicase [Tateyamaria sp. ANG-S1]KIC49269.1 DEAD/DEAH box helicase [Tateyamaria sp. ANG-S1]
MSDFDMMNLPDALAKRVAEMGLAEPTPIQAQAIPHALNGRDVMGLAQTGTGKTAAFGIPLIARLMEEGGKAAPKTARGLILAPTRELAGQIAAVLREMTSMRVQIVVGGVSINPQIQRLAKGADILVATPGRLLDLVDRKAIKLAHTGFLVLDEADQMLDLGFVHALRKIAELMGEDRQTMLFSATMPKQMNEIAQSYLQNPIRVEVNPPGKAADKVTQGVHFIAKAEKSALLIELLDTHRENRALVFTRTKHGADRLARALERKGFAVAAIHGDKRQGQRERALAAFKARDIRVLVATDVAARGLDISDVKFVYNYELPNVPEAYVHRIGRTARAGKDGSAVAFCAPEEMDQLKDIQKVMKLSIPVLSGRAWEPVPDPNAKPAGGRGRGRGRPAGKPGGGRPGAPGTSKPSNRRRRKPKPKGPRA